MLVVTPPMSFIFAVLGTKRSLNTQFVLMMIVTLATEPFLKYLKTKFVLMMIVIIFTELAKYVISFPRRRGR